MWNPSEKSGYFSGGLQIWVISPFQKPWKHTYLCLVVFSEHCKIHRINFGQYTRQKSSQVTKIHDWWSQTSKCMVYYPLSTLSQVIPRSDLKTKTCGNKIPKTIKRKLYIKNVPVIKVTQNHLFYEYDYYSYDGRLIILSKCKYH